MIPEVGHFALILAFCLAVILAVVPAWGAWQRNTAAMGLAPGLAVGMLVFIGISFGCLATAFLQDDFSVALVANNSNSLLPSIYKFSAVWGNHEGSLLLWVLILAAALPRGLGESQDDRHGAPPAARYHRQQPRPAPRGLRHPR